MGLNDYIFTRGTNVNGIPAIIGKGTEVIGGIGGSDRDDVGAEVACRIDRMYIRILPLIPCSTDKEDTRCIFDCTLFRR